MSSQIFTALPRRPGPLGSIALAAFLLAACSTGGDASPTDGSQTSGTASPSLAVSDIPSPSAADGPCLDADVLAAVEAYKHAQVPDEPTMAEVADAFEALDLDGRAAERRDSLVAALRDDNPQDVDSMRAQSIIFSLLPLQSEVDLNAFAC